LNKFSNDISCIKNLWTTQRIQVDYDDVLKMTHVHHFGYVLSILIFIVKLVLLETELNKILCGKNNSIKMMAEGESYDRKITLFVVWSRNLTELLAHKINPTPFFPAYLQKPEPLSQIEKTLSPCGANSVETQGNPCFLQL